MGCFVTFYFILQFSLCVCENGVIEDLKRIDNAAKIAQCVKKILLIQTQGSQSYEDVILTNADPFIGRELYKIQGTRFESRSRSFFDIESIPANGYVVMCKDLNNLKEIIDFLKKDRYWNPRGVFIIAMEKDFEINEVGELLSDNYIFNVSIIANNLTDNAVYTFGPDLDECNKPKRLEFLSKCSNIDKQKHVIKEERNFEGCRVNIASHKYWPFIGFTHGACGIEDYLLETIQKSEGLVFNMIRYKPDEDFGYIHDNFTITGMLTLLQNNEAEIVIGGFYLSDKRRMLFDFTYPYTVDHIRVILPKPEDLKIWQAVYAELTLPTIILSLVYFMLFCLVSIRFALFRGNRKDVTRDILIVYGYFLNNIVKLKIKKGIPRRLFVIAMITFAFLINCVFQAALLSVTTKSIGGVRITDALTAFHTLRPIVAERYLNMVNESKFQSLDCETVEKCMSIVINDKDNSFFTVGSDIPYDHLLWKMEGEGHAKLYKAQDTVGTSLQTILLHKGSPIVSVFKKVITGMQGGGLLNHHFKTLNYDAMRNHLKNEHDEENTQGIHDFNETYYVLFGGLTISVFVFIIEVAMGFQQRYRST